MQSVLAGSQTDTPITANSLHALSSSKSLVTRNNIECGSVGVNHYQVRFLSASGTLLGQQQFSFAQRGDVRDNTQEQFIWQKQKDQQSNREEISFAASYGNQRLIEARRNLPVYTSPHVNAVLGNSPIIEESERSALVTRRLGATFIPSVGTSGQTRDLFARQGEVGSNPWTTESLFDAYRSQLVIPTLSLLLAAHRIGPGGNDLVTPVSLTRRVGMLDCVRGKALHNRLRIAPPGPVAQVEILPSEQALSKPFLQLRYDIDASPYVTRPHYDAVDAVAYFFVDGELWMPVQRGFRPAIHICRAPTTVSTQQSTISGVSESLEEGDLSPEALIKRAISGIHEELGISVMGERQASRAQYLGAFFPDPAWQLELVHQVLVEVDPHTAFKAPKGLDEALDSFAVRPHDIIALSESGALTDPRLELSARMLLAHKERLGL